MPGQQGQPGSLATATAPSSSTQLSAGASSKSRKQKLPMPGVGQWLHEGARYGLVVGMAWAQQKKLHVPRVVWEDNFVAMDLLASEWRHMEAVTPGAVPLASRVRIGKMVERCHAAVFQGIATQDLTQYGVIFTPAAQPGPHVAVQRHGPLTRAAAAVGASSSKRPRSAGRRAPRERAAARQKPGTDTESMLTSSDEYAPGVWDSEDGSEHDAAVLRSTREAAAGPSHHHMAKGPQQGRRPGQQ